MKDTDKIEIYAMNKMYGTVSKDEIRAAFPENDDTYIERDWNTACGFLSGLTDENGICRLDLDAVLDGNTLDFSKNIAVFMIFTALMKNGVMRTLPPQTALRAIPYIESRVAFAKINIKKFERMDKFTAKAGDELRAVQNGDISIDDAFENILSFIPSVENYASVSERDRGRYLPFFEMLYEKSRMCAYPNYTETIGEYIDALS